jgi:hypothetical protein
LPPYTDRPERISQGDIFSEIPFTLPIGDYERRLLVASGVTLSRDCACDTALRNHDSNPEGDPARLVVAMAPTMLFADVPATDGYAGTVKRGRVPRLFYIAEGDGHPAIVVDFHLLQPVPIALALQRNRIGSLDDDWRGRMLDHLWCHLTCDDQRVPRPHPVAAEPSNGT